MRRVRLVSPFEIGATAGGVADEHLAATHVDPHPGRQHEGAAEADVDRGQRAGVPREHAAVERLDRAPERREAVKDAAPEPGRARGGGEPMNRVHVPGERREIPPGGRTEAEKGDLLRVLRDRRPGTRCALAPLAAFRERDDRAKLGRDCLRLTLRPGHEALNEDRAPPVLVDRLEAHLHMERLARRERGANLDPAARVDDPRRRIRQLGDGAREEREGPLREHVRRDDAAVPRRIAPDVADVVADERLGARRDDRFDPGGGEHRRGLRARRRERRERDGAERAEHRPLMNEMNERATSWLHSAAAAATSFAGAKLARTRAPVVVISSCRARARSSARSR